MAAGCGSDESSLSQTPPPAQAAGSSRYGLAKLEPSAEQLLYAQNFAEQVRSLSNSPNTLKYDSSSFSSSLYPPDSNARTEVTYTRQVATNLIRFQQAGIAANLYQLISFPSTLLEAPLTFPIDGRSVSNVIATSTVNSLPLDFDDGTIIQAAGYRFEGAPTPEFLKITNPVTPFTPFESYIFLRTVGILPDNGIVEATFSKAPQGTYTSFGRGIAVKGGEGVEIVNVSIAGFDPAAGETTRLQCDLVPTGPNPKATIQNWGVNITTPGSATPFKTFSGQDPRGPGTVIPTATGLHLDIPWDGRGNNPSQTAQGDLRWTIQTRGVKGNSNFFREVNLLQTAALGVRIINAKPTPESFDPAAGENVTLNFSVETDGLTNPEINWDVEVRDATNTTFYKFPTGHSTDGRTTVPVTIGPWLGNNTSGNIISGPFTWVIAANTTATVAGPGVAPTANNVTVSSNAGSSPKLTVFDAGREIGLAYHTDRTKDSQAQQISRRKLLRNVVEDNTKNWVVRAENLAFSDTTIPDSVTVSLHSTVSNQTVPLQLKREGTTRNFQSETGKLASSNLITLIPRPKVAGVEAKTTYAITEAITKNGEEHIAQDLVDKVMGFIDKFYPGPAQPLGALAEAAALADDTKTTSRIDESDIKMEQEAPTVGTRASQTEKENDNFRHAGFEAVRVTVTDPKVKPETQLSAVVKVAHGADVYVVNLHGDHYGDLLLKQTETESIDYRVGSSTLSPAPDTWIFVACDALDLHDYNGFFTYPHFPKDFDLNQGYTANSTLTYTVSVDGFVNNRPRTFGGRRWRDATPGNAEVLLGYNAPASVEAAKRVNTEFKRELASAPVTTDDGRVIDARIIAWLKANRKVATDAPDGISWLCLNACAWDKRTGYYYYIPYVPPGGTYYVDYLLAVKRILQMDLPKTRVGTTEKTIREFGILEIPGNSEIVPDTDRITGAWTIPPTRNGERLGKVIVR